MGSLIDMIFSVFYQFTTTLTFYRVGKTFRQTITECFNLYLHRLLVPKVRIHGWIFFTLYRRFLIIRL